MRRPATIIGSFLLFHGMATGAPGGATSPPPEVRQFVASGESVLAFQSADLNGDGLGDLVFIVEPAGAANGDPAAGDGGRTLKIALRAPDGALKVVKESRRAVLCRSCGGMLGDPFMGLTASSRTFSVDHHGGSSWRWSSTYKFNYSRRDNTWQLVRVDESSFHASEPAKPNAKTYRPPRDFGKIDVAEFDPENFKGVGAR